MAETAEEAAARIQAEHAARQAKGYDPHPPPKLDPRTPAGIRAAQGGGTPEATAVVRGAVAEMVAKLHGDEPIFVFRAQDILSVMVLSHYAMLLEQYGDMDMIEAVVKWRGRFQEWQRSNPGLVKLPD